MISAHANLRGKKVSKIFLDARIAMSRFSTGGAPLSAAAVCQLSSSSSSSSSSAAAAAASFQDPDLSIFFLLSPRRTSDPVFWVFKLLIKTSSTSGVATLVTPAGLDSPGAALDIGLLGVEVVVFCVCRVTGLPCGSLSVLQASHGLGVVITWRPTAQDLVFVFSAVARHATSWSQCTPREPVSQAFSSTLRFLPVLPALHGFRRLHFFGDLRLKT